MKPAERNMKIICRVIGWTDMDYNIHQYNEGMEWLRLKIAIQERIDRIAATRSFWMWWRKQWELRNREYINYLGLTEDMKLRDDLQLEYKVLYLSEHDPEELKVYPSRVVRQLIEDEAAQRLKFKLNDSQSKAIAAR